MQDKKVTSAFLMIRTVRQKMRNCLALSLVLKVICRVEMNFICPGMDMDSIGIKFCSTVVQVFIFPLKFRGAKKCPYL